MRSKGKNAFVNKLMGKFEEYAVRANDPSMKVIPFEALRNAVEEVLEDYDVRENVKFYDYWGEELC